MSNLFSFKQLKSIQHILSMYLIQTYCDHYAQNNTISNRQNIKLAKLHHLIPSYA